MCFRELFRPLTCISCSVFCQTSGLLTPPPPPPVIAPFCSKNSIEIPIYDGVLLLPPYSHGLSYSFPSAKNLFPTNSPSKAVSHCTRRFLSPFRQETRLHQPLLFECCSPLNPSSPTSRTTCTNVVDDLISRPASKVP